MNHNLFDITYDGHGGEHFSTPHVTAEAPVVDDFDPNDLIESEWAEEPQVGFSLRPYQTVAVKRIEDELYGSKGDADTPAVDPHKSTLLVMATGLGKTVIVAEAVRRRRPGKALMIAHRAELIYQAKTTLETLAAEPVTIEMADRYAHMDHGIVVATVQTLISGMGGDGRMIGFDPKDFSLLVTDECVTGDTLVTLADGSQESIRSLYDAGLRQDVLSVNQDSGAIETSRLIAKKWSIAKKTLRVVLADGSAIRCTPDHLICTKAGFLPASSLTKNHFVIQCSDDERTRNTTRVRESTWGCEHGHSWPMSPSEDCVSAQPQTKRAGHGEVCHPASSGWHPAKDGGERRVGRATFELPNALNTKPGRSVCDLLSGRQEGHFSTMAGEGVAHGPSLVVYGRRFGGGQLCRLPDSDGFISSVRAGNLGWLATGRLWRSCGHSPHAPRLVPFVHEQGGWQPILSDYSPAHSPVHAIQAVQGRESQLSVLRGILPSQRRKFAPMVLPENQVPNSGAQAKGQAVLFGQQSPYLKSSRVISVCEEGEAEVYDLTVEKNHNYFANGLLVHNCHHGPAASYRRIYEYFHSNPNLKHLGVTATPDRADEKALGKVFDSVAMTYEIAEAIKDGWLVPIRAVPIHVAGLDYSSIRTTAGDLNGKDLARVMEFEAPLHEMVQGIVEVVCQAPAGTLDAALGNENESAFASEMKGFVDKYPIRKTLVFAASVAHAERLCEILNRWLPDRACWVCGKTPKEERKQRFTDYKLGKYMFLVNVGVCTEGWDEPTIEVVVMARPTKSRALFTQMLGRGTRALAGVVDGPKTAGARREAIAASDKKWVECIDFVGNAGRHRLVTPADILGGNYDDDVVDRAREIAQSADREPVDMQDAIAEAIKQAEQEKARLAARRAKVRVGAKYHIGKAIDPFEMFAVTPYRARGWEQGKPVTAKMKAMLERQKIWKEDMDYSTARQLIQGLADRREKKLCTYRQANFLCRKGLPPNVSFTVASQWMDAIAKNGWQVPADVRNAANDLAAGQVDSRKQA